MQCAITFCYLGWVAGKVRLEAILAVLPAFCFAGFVGGALVAAGISLGAIGPGQASPPGEAVNWTLAFAVSALSLWIFRGQVRDRQRATPPAGADLL